MYQKKSSKMLDQRNMVCGFTKDWISTDS